MDNIGVNIMLTRNPGNNQVTRMKNQLNYYPVHHLAKITQPGSVAIRNFPIRYIISSNT